MATTRTYFWFLFGTFLSSIGSVTFNVSTAAFLIKAGFSVAQVGVVIGTMRFAGILAAVLLGDLSDRMDPRKLVLWTEGLGFLSSALMALVWFSARASFAAVVVSICLRAFVLGVQSPGRNKIVKLFAGSDQEADKRSAIWINKVTHGSFLVAAILSFFIVRNLNYYWAIGLDALTFLINGIILWRLGPIDGEREVGVSNSKFLDKFGNLFKYAPKIVVLDLLLAVVMCGSNLLTVRMSGGHEILVPIFYSAYGLAVWVSGYLQRISWVQSRHASLWIGWGICFLGLALVKSPLPVRFILFSLSYHFYWLIFHRYSWQIQTQTPVQYLGAVVSARTTLIIIILAAGELLVGSWSQHVSLAADFAWRFVAALAVAGCVVAARRRLK